MVFGNLGRLDAIMDMDIIHGRLRPGSNTDCTSESQRSTLKLTRGAPSPSNHSVHCRTSLAAIDRAIASTITLPLHTTPSCSKPRAVARIHLSPIRPIYRHRLFGTRHVEDERPAAGWKQKRRQRRPEPPPP
ncbi:hypothetical protein NU195Hw_g2361t1 [Hortaea werneckii]